MYCHGCHFSTTSVFKLFQESKGFSYAQTVDILRQYVDLRAVSDSGMKELAAQDYYNNAMKVLAEMFNEHLRNLMVNYKHETYTPAVFDGSAATLDWLFNQRNRDKDVVPYMPYGVVPTPLVFDHLLATIMDREVERRTRSKKTYPEKAWREAVVDSIKTIYKSIDPAYYHSVAYFMGSDWTTFSRIKLRRPSDDKQGNLMVVKGRTDDATERLGYFGLASLVSRFQGKVDGGILKVIIVEGENDALALMEYIWREGKTGYVVLASGGTANELDDLTECGINKSYLLSDAPNHMGDDWVMQKLTTAREMDVHVFCGYGEIVQAHGIAKDPDQLTQALGAEWAFDNLVDRTESYIPLTDWVARKILDDVAALDRDDRSIRAQLGVVRKYGACVRHPASITQLVQQLRTMALPEGDIRRELLSIRDNSEAAFKLAIVGKLSEEFHPLYCVTSTRAPSIRVFHRERRCMVDLSLTDAESAVMAMARMNGGVYEYMRDQIGIPPFLGAAEDAPNTTPERAITPHLHQYLKFALQDFIKGLPTKQECIEYGQGVHYFGDQSGTDVYQIVNNGHLVLKGTYESAKGSKMSWEELPGPSHGHAIFRTQRAPWSREIVRAEDMMEGNAITKDDIKSAIVTIEDIWNKGWVFKHQKVMSKFMAWASVCMSIGYIFPRKLIFHLTGDSHSGKSTATGIFTGGGIPWMQLVEPCVALDNFTEAGLIQTLNHSTLMAICDEFEDTQSNQRQATEIGAAIKLMRNVVMEGGAPVRRGSITGESVEYLVHTHFMLASIQRARDIQDDNRRFDVETRYVEGRGDTVQILLQHYTAEDFRKLRRLLSIGMPKFAREVLETYRRVQSEISTKRIVAFEVQQRFVNHLLPVLTLMEMFGEDWRAFFKEMCTVKQTKITGTQNDTQSAVLYERICRSATLHGSDSREAPKRITDYLLTAEGIRDLNRTRCGVMVIPGTSLMVVEHITAQNKGGVYESWPEYRTTGHRNLKHTLDQHAWAVRVEDYDRNGVPRFLRGQGSAYNPSTISVLNIDPLIKELRDSAVLENAQLPAGRAADALNELPANDHEPESNNI
jgi:hypothetical protein